MFILLLMNFSLEVHRDGKQSHQLKAFFKKTHKKLSISDLAWVETGVWGLEGGGFPNYFRFITSLKVFLSVYQNKDFAIKNS